MPSDRNSPRRLLSWSSPLTLEALDERPWLVSRRSSGLRLLVRMVVSCLMSQSSHLQQSLNPWANESRPMAASHALVRTLHIFLRQLRQCGSPLCPCSSFRQEITAAMLAAPPFSASCVNALQAACCTSYSASSEQEVAAAMLAVLLLSASCGNVLRAAASHPHLLPSGRKSQPRCWLDHLLRQL